ncbi:MAG TPA: thioredoxin [Anaerolineae bacterium]|nr:thioredoxin [Anaerolineae bacterium]
MADMLIVTDDTFEAQVLQAPKPVLVDFWAEWCGPCRMVAPVVEALAEEYAGRLLVAKMDVDENRETPARYGIYGIPTLILFKDGAEATRFIGYRPKEAMEDGIVPYLD